MRRDFCWAIANYMTAVLLTVFATELHAQTWTVLHNFTGPEGAGPQAGLTMDQAGNLYGTTYNGGSTAGNCHFTSGCGVVFKMTRRGSDWTLTPLYKFAGPDGSNPAARVIIAPDGTLYGTTVYGGASNNGVVFRLQPPATACKSVLCPWTETVVYSFTGGADGANPTYGDLTIDRAGNVYGTTYTGGNTAGNCSGSAPGCGVVFELSPSGGGWTESVLHTFQWDDGAFPYAGITFDNNGNIFGTAEAGGTSVGGVIYELTPSGSGWTETVLHNFSDFDEGGGQAYGGLISDSSGNLYGATSVGGQNTGGEAYELSPSNGGWTFKLLYGFDAYQGTLASLAMDSSGNLYGTIFIGTPEIFRLTPSNGQYNLTGFNGSEGGFPYGGMILDSEGNLYGTAGNVVFEITP